MSEVQDCREEVVNNLVMWAVRHGIEASEAKFDLYMLLNNVEITSRCTEIAELQADRNEYLIKKFLIAKQVKGCTARTISMYGTSIRQFLDRVGKNADHVTSDDIRYYMAIRLQKDKVSKVTVGNEIRCVSSFFTWLQIEEIIPRNPMAKVDRIKKRKTKKEALTEIEIEKLRLSTKDERETAIVELLLSTGCRITELINILILDIDGNKILVHGKGEKDRYVYLNVKAELALSLYLNTRNDRNPYLFPGNDFTTNTSHVTIEQGHLGSGTIEHMMRELAKRAGVERANPHKFRRTCATMALRRGMPLLQVSKMLGHESVETTQIYLDLSEDELAEAHKKYVI